VLDLLRVQNRIMNVEMMSQCYAGIVFRGGSVGRNLGRGLRGSDHVVIAPDVEEIRGGRTGGGRLTELVCAHGSGVGAHGESARARGEGCSTSNNAVSLVVPCLDWSHSRSKLCHIADTAVSVANMSENNPRRVAEPEQP